MDIDFNYRGSGKTEAVYWAEKAVRSSRIAFWLMFVAVVLMTISAILGVVMT